MPPGSQRLANEAEQMSTPTGTTRTAARAGKAAPSLLQHFDFSSMRIPPKAAPSQPTVCVAPMAGDPGFGREGAIAVGSALAPAGSTAGASIPAPTIASFFCFLPDSSRKTSSRRRSSMSWIWRESSSAAAMLGMFSWSKRASSSNV